MSSIITLPVSLLLFLAVGLSLTSAGRDGPSLKGSPSRCAGVKCPRPLCADPITPRGECCPSCAQSLCKFEGCVQLRPEVRWYPHRCTPCHCRENGKPLCAIDECFPTTNVLNCFGYPKTTIPTNCCPICDFGVPENACRAVPSKEKDFTITHRSSTCRGTIVIHKCDKIGYREDGKIFRCDPVTRERSVPITNGGCDPFKRLTYIDIVSCKPVEDNTINPEGCDLVVPRPLDERGPEK